jgi:hypothetical protein
MIEGVHVDTLFCGLESNAEAVHHVVGVLVAVEAVAHVEK